MIVSDKAPAVLDKTQTDFAVALRKWAVAIYEIGGIDRSKRVLAMEGIRGLAVLLVFCVHYHAAFSTHLAAGSLTYAVSSFWENVGHSGVELFFVLSGYLIYGVVIKRRIVYGEFIKRRIQRIYPTFSCVFVIYLALSFFFPSENKIPSAPIEAGIYILQNFLLLPGIFNIQALITVAWSLSYEFFFYLFLPLLIAMFGMRRWKGSSRSVLFIALTLAYTTYCLIGPYARYRLIMFFSGVLLYEAVNTYNFCKNPTPRSDHYVLLALVLTFPLIYILSARPTFFRFLPLASEYGGIYRELVLFVSFFVLILFCINSNSLLKNIFSWTPLRWLGNVSYSYYLIHGLTIKAIALVVYSFFQLADPGIIFWVSLPVSFFLTLVSSTMLFIFVEKRFSLVSAAPMLTNVSSA